MDKEILKREIAKTATELAPFLVHALDPDLATNPLAVIAKVGQSIVSHFLSKFVTEYKEKIKSGVLKNINPKTEKPALMLSNLLRIINEGKIDEERFMAMRSIFFSGVSVDAKEQDEVLAYEFLQTAQGLSSTEILILKANFEIANGNISKDVSEKGLDNGKQSRNTWRRIIAKQMGYGDMYSIVAKYEANLEELGLISPRIEMDRLQGDFEPTSKFRLTEMGYRFCEFIAKYN